MTAPPPAPARKKAAKAAAKDAVAGEPKRADKSPAQKALEKLGLKYID